MNEIKSNLFIEDFPPMEKGFYFFAEEATMKQPLISAQKIEEGEIYTIKIVGPGQLEFKETQDSALKVMLNEIMKYSKYEGYDGEIDKLYFHAHNGFEISMVLSGEGYYFAEGRAIKVEAGSVIVFNSLMPHAWLANPDNPPVQKTFTFYHRLFLESELAKEQSMLIKEYLQLLTVLDLHGEQAKESFNILEMMYEEFVNKKPGYHESIKNLLLVFFIYNMRSGMRKHNVIQVRRNGADVQLDNAVQYIKNHFHRNITLEDVAKQVYMHPNYFSASFKKKYGTSFVDYVNALKIAMAIELMESTDMPIQQVASESGFSSLSNFYRVFKGRYDISPAKYIKQN
ncbi:AraC family transcriptional regulator [Niameybacter massiliensis]|uniref:AraC family transcriptional regulator n=1 Tax=Holtiella tumoricola TaxID=3018743 RepID=A0AA42IZV0_9FIRM|nr:AraC family transcriptional regulator [Holtiella tumoricola]MDA3730847.1 AraC family transcriptional regulator [Holtiella tumoricola]